ncbi:ATP-binding cassette domain-containing protein [Magnetospira sp. QH-2]|uniref:ATP-binding cassette domain-containing protein n=1 Tax=Magnetospira sp. (strain QH-2) TaxID=1288970 RepID=UPI0003E80BCB|nr:ATP-binding cassette domain-containing protein [Magnetospira sp. QH-2]CCQ73129.1 putative Molybdenum import ATP-binding protein modC [Magnetospira sp. QH-2]
MIAVDLHLDDPRTPIGACFETDLAGITAIVGPRGSGKTTLLRMIAGLTKPDRGRLTMGERVLFESRVPINHSPDRRRMGLVIPGGQLFPHLSVRKNLVFGREEGRRVGVEEQIGFDDVVALLDLGEQLEWATNRLSPMQESRVALGRALLMQPEMLLLVSPDSAIMALLSEIVTLFKIPVLFTSEDREGAARVAGKLLVMVGGAVEPIKIAKKAPTAAKKSKPKPAAKTEPVAAPKDPLAGEISTVLTAKVWGYDSRDGLTRLEYAPGREISVMRDDLMPGQEVKATILARDVGVALAVPEGLGYPNVLEGIIGEITPHKSGLVDLVIDVGAPLSAQVTKGTVKQLGLAEGKTVYALFKSSVIREELVAE